MLKRALAPYRRCVLHPRLARSGGYASGRSERLYVVPRCYCLLTRAPLFALHLDVLWDVLACERLEAAGAVWRGADDRAPSTTRV